MASAARKAVTEYRVTATIVLDRVLVNVEFRDDHSAKWRIIIQRRWPVEPPAVTPAIAVALGLAEAVRRELEQIL